MKVLKPFKRLEAFKLNETHLKGFRANTGSGRPEKPLFEKNIRSEGLALFDVLEI